VLSKILSTLIHESGCSLNELRTLFAMTLYKMNDVMIM